VLHLPFERSLLHVDGELVAIRCSAHAPGSAITAWESPDVEEPPPANRVRPPCVTSRLRRFLDEACLPFPHANAPGESR